MANQFDFQVGAFFRLLNPGHGFAHKFYKTPPLMCPIYWYAVDPVLLEAVPSSEARQVPRNKKTKKLLVRLMCDTVLSTSCPKVYVDLAAAYQIQEVYESLTWQAVSFYARDRRGYQQILWTNVRKYNRYWAYIVAQP